MKFLACTTLFAAALTACGSTVVVADASVPDATPTGPSATSPLAACQPTLASFTPSGGAYGTMRAYLGTSPNDGLILNVTGYYNTEGTYHRASSGAVVFHPPVPRIVSRDQAWQREARIIVDPSNGLTVATAITNRTLLTTEAPATSRAWDTAALDASGAVLFASACLEDHVRVQAWDVDAATVIGHVDIVAACNLYGEGMLLAATAERGVAMLGIPSLGAVHRIDLVHGTDASVVAHRLDPSMPTGLTASPLLDVAVSPDGARVFTTGADLALRTWDAHTLQAVGGDLPSGFGIANENIYAPTFGVAPIAVSSAGDLIAHTGTNGDVVLRALADGHALATLHDPSTMVRPHDAPSALAFARDGSYLAATYPTGLAIWTCPDHVWPQPSHPLAVTIAGPATMNTSAPVTFTATHMGTENVHAHHYLVDGVSAGDPSFDRTFTWTPIAGSHTLSVEIDDGIDTGRASLAVNVSP